MANNYYNASGSPSQGSGLNSVTVRNELGFIEDGFDKLPSITGNASKLLQVNASETGLEASSQSISSLQGLSLAYAIALG